MTTHAASRFGFWAALSTGLSTLVTFAIAIATPPRSGRLCTEDCFSYPYLDIAARFPRDYFWMFPAIVATLSYLAFVIALYARVASAGRQLAQLGLALSAMAALTLVSDYFVQLAVIQPSLRAGEADGVSLLTQYNPHGVFIALEELGYLLMSLSLACMNPALSKSIRLERAIRWLFLGGLFAMLAALGWFSLRYGHDRGYLFEIASISIDWLVVIVGSLMTAAVFRRDLAGTKRSGASP